MFKKLFGKTDKPTYSPGQVWKYHTRKGEENSLLTIVKTEMHPTGEVIHVSVTGVSIPNHLSPDGITSEIMHLPFAKEWIDQSVTELVSENTILPDFESGYQQWKMAFDEGKAGVFAITVAKSVDVMEQALAQNNRR